MARPRDLKRERTWRQHFERQPDSGRSIRDYCSGHDLDEAAFYRWRRILADRGREPGLSPAPAFVPMTLVQTPMASNDTPIDIHLRGGSRVRVRSGCDRELLAAVLVLLEEGRSC
jgi:transposase-like protein